ncbi:MAG: S41 family peptidase, partial [Actinomycetota bacterium]
MVGRSPNKKVTVRTSGKSSAGKRSTTKRVKSEFISPISKQEVNSGENEFKDKDQRNSQVEKKNDRVSLIFLGVFIAALFFVLGTGFGNSTGKSLIEGAIDELVSNSTVAVDREILERAAIEGALKASGDDWANYFPSSTLDELNNSTANVLTGIGISIREARSGAIEIASIQESTPAFKNGLKVGDQILEVNGTDVQGSSLTTVVALIRGDLGKEVVLRVNRDGAIQIFSLLTERIDVRTVDASQIAPEIAYLSVNSFSSGTSSEFYNALRSLKSSKGVVIDLRDNPGGLVEEAVSIAELFIGRGTVVSYRANGEERIFTANNPKPSVA